MLNFPILIIFFLFSFSCFTDDYEQFSLMVEPVNDQFKEATFMANRDSKKKSLNSDVEQYFHDGHYVCPNAKCDRK